VVVDKARYNFNQVTRKKNPLPWRIINIKRQNLWNWFYCFFPSVDRNQNCFWQGEYAKWQVTTC